MFGVLAGLDLSASIKRDDSPVSALSGNPGDRRPAPVPDILLTYELSSGGSVQRMQHEAARVSAASNMRRQPVGAVPVVAVESGAQHRLANDLAKPSNEEVNKACQEARAMLEARNSSRSPTIDTAILIATGNISAETLAAEADPCKALDDKLGAPMEGHVIVITANHGGGQMEVPISTTPAPLSEEEKQIQRAMYIFLGSCLVVAVCMIGFFFATIYIVRHKKELADKLADIARTRGTARKSKFKHMDSEEASAPASDNGVAQSQMSEPISADEVASAKAASVKAEPEVASAKAESEPDPDF